MRLFVAVTLTDDVIAAAVAAAGDLRQRVDPSLKPKWVDAANMHLTVRFIGQVADDAVGALLDVLRPPLALPSFEVVLGECGVFPPSGSPRVIWIGLESGLAELRRMHEECNRRLRPLGFLPEARPFTAHLTLARFKDVPRGSGDSARTTARSVRPVSARCHVNSATVFESRLSPRGPTYHSLFTISCAG